MRHNDATSDSPQRPTPPPEATSRRVYTKPVLRVFGAASALTETNSMIGQMDGFMGRRTG